MRTFMRSTPPTRDQPGQVVSLETLESKLSQGMGRRPSDTAFVRETARVLRAMDGVGAHEIPTLVCERASTGMRIVEGREALQVARELRARAAWRGDHTWAWLLGRRLSFRIVVRK